MNKKIFGAIFLVGVLVLMGASCENKSLTKGSKQTDTNAADVCGPTKEISSSNALANELKVILNEAGAEVKLITDLASDSPAEGTLVFVWKKKPTTKNLKNAFKKYGYKIEIVGESIVATKGNVNFSINLAEGENCQKISVRVTNKTIKSSGTVTTEECAELFAFAPKIDLRYNDLSTSYPWTLKYYDRMAALEKKYGITQDELSKSCKAKANEPGFNEEVKKQGQKLDAIIK